MASIPVITKDQWASELIPAEKPKGFYICPFCSSGIGKNGKKTAAFSFKDQQHGHCFSCNFYGDRYDAELKFMGIEPDRATREQKAEAVKRVEARYGFPSLKGSEKPAAVPADPPPAADFSAQLRLAADRLPGSPGEAYLSGRGLTQETMKRFRLGYDPAWTILGGKYESVIMPYNETNSFFEVRTLRSDDKVPRPHDVPHGVPREIFNAKALYSDQPCFVVESALCAMSIMQEGGSAVAIGGLGQIRMFLNTIKREKPSAMLILSLDNDPVNEQGHRPGPEAQAKLAEDLTAAGVRFIQFNVAGSCNDPNELLQKDPAMLRLMVESGLDAAGIRADELKEEARQEEAERDKRTGPGMIDSFLQDVSTRMYEPLPTGIKDIDLALDGGFIRQQLICLGAAPGAGKTALAQWIFEGMAAKGVGCIFLNLEMSRNQILARSLSRYVARRGLRISSARLMRGYSWTDDQRDAIMEAAEEYKQTIAPQMIYNPDNVTTNLDVIMEYLEREALKAEASNKAAPCVVLDYLQIVTGREREDGTELIKRAVAELKGFAVRHNTVVFLIIAHNRESNRSGTITMESGRDSSAIEYSGDTQIGLTFTRCLKGWKDEHGITQNKGKSPDELTKDDRQWITLKIVKSRFSEPGRTVNLRFDGETMTYTQTLEEFTPVSLGDDWETITK